MRIIENIENYSKIKTPKTFEIYFMSKDKYRGNRNRVFSKAVGDYQLSFGVSSDITHVAVRIGEFIYELVEEGLVKYAATEAILSNERVVAFYSVDMSKYRSDSRIAALFVVENYLGYKLDIGVCLSYLKKFLATRLSGVNFRKILSYNQDLTMEHGTFDTVKGRFKLPFTCTSPANYVIDLVFDIEPSFQGHLAGDLFNTATCLASDNIGMLYIGE